ncbi:MAG TPA: hypothetical protein VI451_11080 [Anaerolineales bacterium]|nr:hypothetical protein [Anaerolineales bacterium]
MLIMHLLIVYLRAPWFRLVRDPLKLGMYILAWAYRVDPAEYEVRTPACYGCLRFYKTALKEKSTLFRWLNDRVNPIFDALLEWIVTPEEPMNYLFILNDAPTAMNAPTMPCAWR